MGWRTKTRHVGEDSMSTRAKEELDPRKMLRRRRCGKTRSWQDVERSRRIQ